MRRHPHLAVRLPEGTKAHYLDHPEGSTTLHSSEHEVLVRRGTRYKVLKHDTDEHGCKRVHIKAIHQYEV